MDEEDAKRIGPLLKDNFRKLGRRTLPVGERIEELQHILTVCKEEESTAGIKIAQNKVRDLVHSDELADHHRTLLHLYVGNSNRLLSIPEWASDNNKSWETPALEDALKHYKEAIAANRRLIERPNYTGRVLRQSAKLYCHVGRPVEAMSHWRGALRGQSQQNQIKIEMATGITRYADHIHIVDYRARMYRYAIEHINEVLEEDGLSEKLRSEASNVRDKLGTRLQDTGPPKEIEACNIRLGQSQLGHEYALWCLNEHLYLNPLNDLFNTAVGHGDTLHLPSMRVDPRTGLSPLGLYNILKQEFVSSRYNFYRGSDPDGGHHSDNNVNMAETPNLPALGYDIECLKNAYKTAYSIFDKIAFFLNEYLDIGIENDKLITFRRIWYEGGQRGKGLRDEFRGRSNWPMKGLFWLSKDIYEEAPGFRDTTNPDAKRLDTIRNITEHRYLALNMVGSFDPTDLRTHGTAFGHPLGEHMGFPEFRRYTYRVLQLAREALIYIALGVHVAEPDSTGSSSKDKRTHQIEELERDYIGYLDW